MESGIRIHTTEFEWPKNMTPSGFSMKVYIQTHHSGVMTYKNHVYECNHNHQSLQIKSSCFHSAEETLENPSFGKDRTVGY